MNTKVIVATVLLQYCIVISWAAEVKYAPSYCLRFRFNCERPEKKGHVCCIYPLPDAGGAAQEQASPPATNIRFRPLKLPTACVKNSEETSDDKQGHHQNKPAASSVINKGRPLPKSGSGSSSNSRTTTKAPGFNVKPRICERLVINCKNSPEHRCCQYEALAAEETTPRDDIPVDANTVKVKEVPIVVKGEAIPVPLENPAEEEAFKKYEEIINHDKAASVVPDDAPYERIPAECFTEAFDCQLDPGHKCCPFLE